ncbi:MAG: hypothetical protein ACREQM_22725 [Candidatus Dormibacteraceae bacterium]
MQLRGVQRTSARAGSTPHELRQGPDNDLGIGRRYAAALEQLGLADYDTLMSCDPRMIVLDLHAQRRFVSVAHVEQWRRHAQAYRESREVVFEPPAPVGESLIAFGGGEASVGVRAGWAIEPRNWGLPA